MSKIYILDTNVLLHDPRALFAFDDNEVVIPLAVLDELDNSKKGHDDTARNARVVVRSLDGLREFGNLHDGVTTESGGVVRVELNHIDFCPNSLDKSKVDNRLISVALGLIDSNPDCVVKLITKDINLRVKCDALNIHVEDYNADQVAENTDSIYSGFERVDVSSSVIDQMYADGEVDATDLGSFYPNQYAQLVSVSNFQHMSLARYTDGKFVKLISVGSVWGISARNREQACAMDALFNPNVKLVSLIGLAGSGKTLCAVAAGVSQVLDSGKYNRIIMSRPIEPMGRDIGFLPGNLDEKLAPWMAPLHDNLDLIFSSKGTEHIDTHKDSGVIQVEALTYIRGRSIPQSFMIIDEAQNLGRHEIKTIITRVSEGTKVVLTGDIQQIDNLHMGALDNGLSYAVEKFKNYDIAAHITLQKGERSELATLAAEIM